jgi:hypothetical protein
MMSLLAQQGGLGAMLAAAAPAAPALSQALRRTLASFAGPFASGGTQQRQALETQTQSEKAAVSAFVQEVRRSQ